MPSFIDNKCHKKYIMRECAVLLSKQNLDET